MLRGCWSTNIFNYFYSGLTDSGYDLIKFYNEEWSVLSL